MIFISFQHKCDPLCRKVTFVGNHEILVIYIIVICGFLALIKCKLHHRSSNIARAIRHYFTRNVESIKDKFLRNSSLKIYSCSRFRVHGVRPEKKIDMCKPRPLTTDKSDTGTIVLVQRSWPMNNALERCTQLRKVTANFKRKGRHTELNALSPLMCIWWEYLVLRAFLLLFLFFFV